jgi:Cu+-exporting ATPase
MNLQVPTPEHFTVIPGMGVRCHCADHDIHLGNACLMQQSGTAVSSSAQEIISALENQGKTTVLLSVDRTIIGIIGIADVLKDTSAEAVEQLNEMNIQTVMLTGDNKKNAESVAECVGIKRVVCQVLPDQKAKVVREVRGEKRHVAMVGDGVNDAPALAAADVGIATGSGTDIAVEAGEVVLLRDDPRDVAAAIRLSKHTLRKIRQNLLWAFAYNTLLIPLAAGLLVPIFGIGMYEYLPFPAAVAMAFSSVTVVANSLLLARVNIRRSSSKADSSLSLTRSHKLMNVHQQVSSYHAKVPDRNS